MTLLLAYNQLVKLYIGLMYNMFIKCSE